MTDIRCSGAQASRCSARLVDHHRSQLSCPARFAQFRPHPFAAKEVAEAENTGHLLSPTRRRRARWCAARSPMARKYHDPRRRNACGSRRRGIPSSSVMLKVPTRTAPRTTLPASLTTRGNVIGMMLHPENMINYGRQCRLLRPLFEVPARGAERRRRPRWRPPLASMRAALMALESGAPTISPWSISSQRRRSRRGLSRDPSFRPHPGWRCSTATPPFLARRPPSTVTSTRVFSRARNRRNPELFR